MHLQQVVKPVKHRHIFRSRQLHICVSSEKWFFDFSFLSSFPSLINNFWLSLCFIVLLLFRFETSGLMRSNFYIMIIVFKGKLSKLKAWFCSTRSRILVSHSCSCAVSTIALQFNSFFYILFYIYEAPDLSKGCLLTLNTQSWSRPNFHFISIFIFIFIII